MTDIQAWETEDGDAVIWGTHHPELAYEAYEKWLVEVHGDCVSCLEEYRIPFEEFETTNTLRWGHPDLLDEEDWGPKHNWVSPFPEEGFVPFMVVIR